MTNPLDTIEQQVRGKRDYDAPPLHLWHPDLSGDIDIRIDANGQWYHEGSPVTRDALVRLFASILRREDDGEYYLVTPAEKWRINVELHPLLVTDIATVGEHGEVSLLLTLNTGKQVLVDSDHPLFTEPAMDNVAAVELDNGLSALFTRNAWYRLVDLAEQRSGQTVVTSAGQTYILG